MAGGVTSEIPSGELSTALRAIARAAGIPSLDEYDAPEIRNVWHGQWNVGTSTASLAQMSFYAESGGHIGDGAGFALTVSNATWDGDSTRKIQLAGAFADFTWYPGAYITVTSGTGWTGAERYPIKQKDNDDQIELEDEDSIDSGVAFPSGTNSDLTFTVSTREWASVQVPIPAPVGPSASNPNRNFPASAGGQVPEQSFWWDYPTVALSGGELTSGAVLGIYFTGRIKVDNVAKRPGGAVSFYLIVDPMGSVMVQDNRRNSGQVGRVRTTRVGWEPGSHATASVQYAEGTISSLGGKMLITLPGHSLQSGDGVHLFNAPLDPVTLAQGNIDDIEEARLVYACLDDIDAAITDPTNTFTVSLANPSDRYDPVAYNVVGTPGRVCVTRSSQGSFKRIVFPFQFTASEETDNDGFQYVEGAVVAVADGATDGRESGVVWKGMLHVLRFAEHAPWGAPNVQKPIAMGTADRVATAAISRTRPGNSMNTAGSGTESMIGAPLFRLKTNAYTDGLAVQHHAYANTMFDFGGAWDIVEIDQKLHGEAFYSAGQIVVDAGSYNAANRTIQQAAKFTSYSFTRGDKFRVTGGDGWTPGYYEIEAKEANNRIRLKADPRLPLANNTNTTGDIDEYPLVSYLGEESGNPQVGNLFTATKVLRGTTYLGHVVEHQNLLQRIWVARQLDGEYVKPGDVLTLQTYRRTRVGGTGNFTFNETTPLREYTVTAGRVWRSPKIPLSLRIAVSGPPNGDCQLEVRQGMAVLMRHRSR